MHEHYTSTMTSWIACVKCKYIIWKIFHFSGMLNFHIACSLSSCANLYKVKSNILYMFQMLVKSLRNFSFPSLPSLPIPFSFHMINLTGLCHSKTKSLLCQLCSLGHYKLQNMVHTYHHPNLLIQIYLFS